MRILICGINYSPELTGIGKYTGEMAEWLASRGHQVRVVTAPPYYPMWRVAPDYYSWRYSREKQNGVKVYRCPLWVPSVPSGLTRILHLASFALSSLWVILWQGLRWRPHVVWMVEPPFLIAPAALIAGWLGGCRTWLHVQDFEVDAVFDLGFLNVQWPRRAISILECWLMRLFDCVSTISEPMLERLVLKGVDKRQSVLFPNWIDGDSIYPLEEPNPMRRELGIPDGEMVALYSGNMGVKQGLEILVAVARLLADENNIHFVFSGDGAARMKLQNLSSELPNVHFLPLQSSERLNQLLNLANVHLLPQRASAADLVLPSKLTGMLASGRPIVATALPGTQIARIVEDCGVVVPPNDAPAFVKSIKFLVENEKERVKFGKAGRAYAIQHWEKEKVLNRFQAALCRNL